MDTRVYQSVYVESDLIMSWLCPPYASKSKQGHISQSVWVTSREALQTASESLPAVPKVKHKYWVTVELRNMSVEVSGKKTDVWFSVRNAQASQHQEQRMVDQSMYKVDQETCREGQKLLVEFPGSGSREAGPDSREKAGRGGSLIKELKLLESSSLKAFIYPALFQ